MTDVLVCSTIDLIMIKLNINNFPKHMFQMRNILFTWLENSLNKMVADMQHAVDDV